MNLKNVKRFKKLILFAGVSLGSLVIVEAGQAVVRALESGDMAMGNSSPLNIAEGDWIDLPQHDPPQQDPRLQPNVNTPTSTSGADSSAQELDQNSDLNDRSSSQRQLVAVNTGEADQPQQSVASVAPSQIAASDWYGASFPVENFQAYTSPFGYRSSPEGGYSTEFHYGLDMAAPEGSYIRNWWGGKVIEVSDDSNCGTSVVIESGPWMHIYCHMRGHVEEDGDGRYMIDRDGGIQIWEGQEITAGARIGRVGMTGRTTGPHLHWGLKYDENWVDPALVLRAMYSTQRAASQPTTDSTQ